jgi:hypothetical protein
MRKPASLESKTLVSTLAYKKTLTTLVSFIPQKREEVEKDPINLSYCVTLSHAQRT